MSIVADSGPLMALAKVGGLDALFRLFPTIITPPGVHEELVTAGQALGAADAADLAARYASRHLTVVEPMGPPLPLPIRLGRGEAESIRLAIEHRAEWLLVDDLEARRAAIESFRVVNAATQIKGTLGVVLSAHVTGHLSQNDAFSIVQALNGRPDVWISADLIRKVIELLRG